MIQRDKVEGVCREHAQIRGWALHEAGQTKAGDALMESVKHRTLGDERSMAILADTMAAHDHPEDALTVRTEITLLGAPRTLVYYDTCRFLAVESADRLARSSPREPVPVVVQEHLPGRPAPPVSADGFQVVL